MDKQYLIKLLNRYLQGKTTDEENKFLINYYNLFESVPKTEASISSEKKEELNNQMIEDLWQHIDAEETKDKKAIVINKWVTRMAAASILVAVCTMAVYFFPGHPASEKIAESRHFNTQKENRVIHLDDGSTVILSSGSKLSYPSSFKDLAKREVFLEGEAFFEISHHPSQLFIVHTGILETTVLGTAFNIKALQNGANIIITVKRGKVKVAERGKVVGLITKGQQIDYNKSKGSAVQKTANTDSAMTWKKQDLLLDDATVGEAAKLLEDKFDVNISFSDRQMETQRFTTVFLQNENLEQILKSICEFNGASYIYNKEKATVTISKIKPN